MMTTGRRPLNGFSRQFFPLLPVLVLSVVLGLSFPSCAAAGIEIDADGQFDFAAQYFDRKQYRESADEYRRFIHFFPQDKRIEQALFNIGRACFYGRRYEDALAAFQALIDQYIDTPLSFKAYAMISECHLARKEFGRAEIVLYNLLRITEDAAVKDDAHYRLGWIAVETGAWEKARRQFGQIGAQNRDRYRLQRLSAELDRAASIPRKDPQLAGFLSLFPGAGQFYNERYQDGLIAFLVNAGLILAAYESFDNELYALGGLVTFVEVGFYSGNIYGAVSGAHKYNQRQTGDFIRRLKENARIRLSAGPDGRHRQRFVLALQYAF